MGEDGCPSQLHTPGPVQGLGMLGVPEGPRQGMTYLPGLVLPQELGHMERQEEACK